MMIIMTLKIITEIVNQIKSNQNKRKKKRNNKSQTKTHTQKEEKKKTTTRTKQKKKTKQNKYSETKMEQRDAKGSADSQNLISIFEKHHRCPN